MKNKIFEKYSIIFWVFIVGSFAGFIHENLLTFLKGEFVLRRGLIYEPLIPIYGIGLLIFYLSYNGLKLKSTNTLFRVFAVFIVSFFLGGLTEYMCSLIQEKFFGTISWDYSYLKFNLNGRTSLIHATFWGMMGILFYELLLPILVIIREYILAKNFKTLTIILTLILLFDCSISSIACSRQRERRKNIEPSNSFEEFLDKHYSDEYLEEIYNNAKHVD